MSAPQVFLLLLLTLFVLSHASASATSLSLAHPTSRRNAVCPRCAPSKRCVGPPGNKKCVTPMPAGKACGIDPFWVCQTGLQCIRNICRRGKLSSIPRGERCDKPGVRCRPHLVCAGSIRVKKCVMPMRAGKPCGRDPFWVCKKGLVCREGVCRGVKTRGGCNGGRGCSSGRLCVGPPRRLRCVKPMGKGDRCGQDPYWVCQRGLRCSSGICV